MGQIQYSEKYFDDTFEYRHVVLPSDVAKLLPKNRLLSESEWRAIGVQQSRGWVHYAIHRPEPHIMLFRRVVDGCTMQFTDPSHTSCSLGGIECAVLFNTCCGEFDLMTVVGYDVNGTANFPVVVDLFEGRKYW
nr:cyclin-dependent kinases regulatory subunit 1 [Tanacetum cinerariifolium]